MRRLALLFTAILLALVTSGVAHAQYPVDLSPDEQAQVNSLLESLGQNEIGAVVSLDTAKGVIKCTVVGARAGTQVSCTITYTKKAGTAARAFDADAGAVAFVGAQAATGTITLSGTADANGTAALSGSIPADMDTSAPLTAAAAGTARDGSVAVASAGLNQAAEPPATGGETTPATGAESGILALIALGLLGAGAGAVVLARRKTHAGA